MKARPWRLAAGIDQAKLAAFTGILAGLNAVSPKLVDTYAQQGFILAFVVLGGISAGVWFALAGCYIVAHEAGAAEAAGPRDLIVAAGVGLATILPSPEISAAAVLVGGLYFALLGAARSRRIGIILLGVSGAVIGGKLVLLLFAPVMLSLDGALVGALARTSVTGNIVGFQGGSSFVIGSGCSSVHNLTFALLLWTTFTQMLALPITRRLVLFGVLAMAATVLINVCRLVTIALMPQHFEYLHTGAGGAMFGWLTLMVGAIVVAAGAYGEARRPV